MTTRRASGKSWKSNFPCHSLSVSDVFVLNREGGEYLYSVDGGEEQNYSFIDKITAKRNQAGHQY